MTDRTRHRLTELLGDGIPLTGYMGVHVAARDADSLTLSAPLAPNVNHKGTAFGGSLAALATVAGWAMVATQLLDADLEAELVIYRSDMRYLRPVTGDLLARATTPEAAERERFLRDLRDRGRASMEVLVEIVHDGQAALTFSGEYVARIPDDG